MDARTFLSRDPLRYMDMLDALEHRDAAVLCAGDDGVALLRDGLLYLTAPVAETYETKFRPFLADAAMLLFHEDFLVPEFQSDPRFSSYLPCHQCVYEPRTPIPYALPAGASIRPLDETHIPFVAEHYKTVVNCAEEAVRRGMFGVFMDDGACAGFIGMHEEGTMGMLEILPAYRRHHLAFALEAHLINHLLEVQAPCIYCHVDVQNAPSLALQKRLGETIDGNVLHWFW